VTSAKGGGCPATWGIAGGNGQRRNRRVHAIKICGITREDDALFAARCGVQALGFIFYPRSPRCIEPERARTIIGRLTALSAVPGKTPLLPCPVFPFPGRVATVGVFVNEKPERILEIAAYCGIDLIQLHGDESPEDCRFLPRERLIKALSLERPADLERLRDYPVRAVLVDVRERERYGGTGKRADWILAAQAARLVPLILAGGLAPENIREAVAAVHPAALDLNSGVESAPGIKDHQKIQAVTDLLNTAS
jgi:phosphoribosylanthranilate isomerase